MTLSLYSALFIFATIMVITPGPANLLLMSAGAQHGFYKSVPFVIGVTCGKSFLTICLGIGFYETELGNWSIALAATGAFSAIISMFTNLGLDKHLNPENDQDAVGYPGFAGFELEDGIYLIAPITWAGYLLPFFIAAGICAGIYCLWTVINLLFFR